MKGQGNICFGLLKCLARYLVNWSQEVSMRLVCPLTLFLLFIPHHPIILKRKLVANNLIKEKFIALIEPAFRQFYKNEGTLYLACNDKNAFFTSSDHKGYKLWSCQNVCDALSKAGNLRHSHVTKTLKQAIIW